MLIHTKKNGSLVNSPKVKEEIKQGKWYETCLYEDKRERPRAS